MSRIVSMDMRDGISPELHRLLKKSRNLSPAMRKIEEAVMRPLKRRAWLKSGLHADTGELRDAVETWHGKKSAGISVHTSPGKDLIIPKATLHTQGAERGQYRGKDRYRVRQHTRGGRSIRAHSRRNTGSPWGKVKARKFIPADLGAAGTETAIRILEDYIDV